MPATARVLLVDDDPSLRAALKFALELEGFEVEVYATAEELERDAVFADSSCLVVDYRLPGMDGLALLAKLHDRGVTAPAIVITSNPPKKLRQAISNANAVLVEKPLLCDELKANILGLLGTANA